MQQATVQLTTTASPSSLEQKVDVLMQQMVELGRQNAALLAEVQELRRENERLRRERDAAVGRQVHEPYTTAAATLVGPTGVEVVFAAAAPDGGAVAVRPGTPPRGAAQDMLMDSNSPPPKQDLKRAKSAAEELEPNA